MKITTFQNLIVWQKAHSLMIETYKLSLLLPEEEKYNRKSQLNRSASSVPANIAEGFGRYHYKENIQFCRQARGSLCEMQNHVIAVKDLKQASQEECEKILQRSEDVLRLLNAYLRSTKNRQEKPDTTSNDKSINK